MSFGGRLKHSVLESDNPPAVRHETVLHSFTGGFDGQDPQAGVIRDRAGNLYGTTAYGGQWNGGVVYKVDAKGHETVLYCFTGFADGANPVAGIIRDSAGNFYGTTSRGTGNKGAAYVLDSAGHLTVLHSFTGGADGGTPYAGVIRSSTGILIGTASTGGKQYGGVVFKLKP